MNSSFWSEAECVSKFISRCAVPMNVRLQPGVLLLDLQSSAPGHGAVLQWTNSACKSISELSVAGKAAASSSHTAAVAPVWESFYWRCSFGCSECRSAVRWWCQMSDWPGVLTPCSFWIYLMIWIIIFVPNTTSGGDRACCCTLLSPSVSREKQRVRAPRSGTGAACWRVPWRRRKQPCRPEGRMPKYRHSTFMAPAHWWQLSLDKERWMLLAAQPWRGCSDRAQPLVKNTQNFYKGHW